MRTRIVPAAEQSHDNLDLLSTHLRAYTGHRSKVEAEAATLDEALRDLNQKYPGLRLRIIDEQDCIREHIKIFVNAQQVHAMSTPLKPDDLTHIIGAFSGG